MRWRWRWRGGEGVASLAWEGQGSGPRLPSPPRHFTAKNKRLPCLRFQNSNPRARPPARGRTAPAGPRGVRAGKGGHADEATCRRIDGETRLVLVGIGVVYGYTGRYGTVRGRRRREGWGPRVRRGLTHGVICCLPFLLWTDAFRLCLKGSAFGVGATQTPTAFLAMTGRSRVRSAYL